MIREVICNLCGSNQQVAAYKTLIDNKDSEKKSYLMTGGILNPPEKIVKCVKCGLIFVPLEEDPEKFLSNYTEMVDDNYIKEEKGRRMTARLIIKKLNEFKKQGSRLLDIGCCTGFLLDEARKRGWEVYGVEPSKWAAEYAMEKLHLKIYNIPLENVRFPDGYFDAVIMQDTIEHLLNPKQTLTEIKRILKQDSILYINTPDIESLASRFLKAKCWDIKQYHLYYFSKKTLNKLLEATGFEVTEWSSHSRTFTMKYWIERFKYYNKPIYKISRLISQIDIFGKSLLRINLRDQIQVLARKR